MNSLNVQFFLLLASEFTATISQIHEHVNITGTIEETKQLLDDMVDMNEGLVSDGDKYTLTDPGLGQIKEPASYIKELFDKLDMDRRQAERLAMFQEATVDIVQNASDISSARDLTAGLYFNGLWSAPSAVRPAIADSGQITIGILTAMAEMQKEIDLEEDAQSA